MKKTILTIFLILFTALQTQAFEDCIVTTKGKLTNISIEDNAIVDVYPLVTIANNKNTLFFHPLKVGETKVSVLKNGKETVFFNIKITEDKTTIADVNDFEIIILDNPPNVFEVDLPPEKLGGYN